MSVECLWKNKSTHARTLERYENVRYRNRYDTEGD
jgi:hypothetical protein